MVGVFRKNVSSCLATGCGEVCMKKVYTDSTEIESQTLKRERMDKHLIEAAGRPKPKPKRAPFPRPLKDLTPSKHFHPSKFFYEMVWKALLTPRTGEPLRPKF